MRYFSDPISVFTDFRGKSFNLREIPELEQTGNYIEVEHNKKSLLDAYAAKYFGEGSENLAFRIFDENIIQILENNFSLEKIKNIKIPK